MKIALFHTTLPAPGRKVGGVEVFVHRLATSLINAGFDVEVVSLTEAPPGAVYTHRRLFKRLPFLSKRRVFRLFLLPLLLNLVDFRRYDIVHFHGDDWFYVLRGSPSIRSFHGSALFEARSATRLARKLAQRIVYPLEQFASHLANVVLGVGAEAAKLYNADGIEKLFISQRIFFPSEKSVEPTFIFVGLWEGRKRGKFVAERFLRDVVPHCPKARLLMACDHVPDSDAIIDLRHPSDEDLARAIRASWALLSASTYEGFGIPYLEAISSGTVVITTHNSGADYVLDGGKSGLIVSEEDYSDTILRLIFSPELRRRYEALGLERAAAFSEEQVIEEHVNFYRLAIQRFKTRSPS